MQENPSEELNERAEQRNLLPSEISFFRLPCVKWQDRIAQRWLKERDERKNKKGVF